MSELDDFRPRIFNWARIYKNRFSRAQSPLAVVLHNLEVLKGDPKKIQTEEGRAQIDEADADLIDHCVLRLSKDRRRVLYVAYLDRKAAETYETTEDQHQADKVKAHKLGCTLWGYKIFLRDAENELMQVVKLVEALQQRALLLDF